MRGEQSTLGRASPAHSRQSTTRRSPRQRAPGRLLVRRPDADRRLAAVAAADTFPAIVAVAAIALLGDLRPGDVAAAAWGWPAGLAVVCSVASISLFFAGLRRVGATTASILATLEPLVTVVLAALIFGERMTGPQLAGAAMMLAAVLVLTAQRAPIPRPNPSEVPPCTQCPLAR